MTQVAIKIKRYTGNVNIVNNNNFERRILNMMLVTFGFLSLCYILFLGSMISNIIARKSAEVNTRNLSSQVSDLELQYLSMSNKINLPLAESMGFKETKQQYATRKYLGSLNIANNEL